MQLNHDIIIRVRGKRAERVYTCDLATGNNDITVRFDILPDDPIWADKVLSASFEAVTHVGAKIRDTAKVSLYSTAKIPASVLREPAKALYIGLHGTAAGGLHGTAADGHGKHKDADTTMALVGPVKPGAGGHFGWQGPNGRSQYPCRCDDEDNWNFERVRHEVFAWLSEYEPAMRKVLAASKKSTSAVEEFREELARLTGVSHVHENIEVLEQISFATDQQVRNLFD